MARHILVVRSRPVAGQDAEYNEWYDNTHVPDLLKVPGVLAARRYRAQPSPKDGEAGPAYLAVYDLESDDLDAIMAGLNQVIAVSGMSPAFDLSSVNMTVYSQL